LADARTHGLARTDSTSLVGLLRQSVFGRPAGYEDVNDAERLCRDPAMRWVVGDGAPTGQAASTSQMGRFETEWLTQRENLAALADLPGLWIDAVRKRRPPRVIVLDMDSSESPTYGEQEGTSAALCRFQPAWRSGAVFPRARATSTAPTVGARCWSR
jgi:hypothetical protein